MSVWQTCSQFTSMITIFPWVRWGSLCSSISHLFGGMSYLNTEYPSPVLSWESREWGVALAEDQRSDCAADSWGGPGLRKQMQKSTWVGKLGGWAEGGFWVCCIAIPGAGGWNRQNEPQLSWWVDRGWGNLWCQPWPHHGTLQQGTILLAGWPKGPGTHDMTQAARPSWGLVWEQAFCHFCHIPLVKAGPGPSTDLRGQGHPRTWILGGLIIGIISPPSHPCSHLFPSLQPIWRAQRAEWCSVREGWAVQISSPTCLCVFGSWHGRWQLGLPRVVPLPALTSLPPSPSPPPAHSLWGRGRGRRGL